MGRDAKHTTRSGGTPLICEPHYERQSDIEPQDISFVETSDLSPESLASNRDWFIGHHL